MTGDKHLDLRHVREEYMRESLDEAQVRADPLDQFRLWFDEAVSAAVPMVNAMTLATATLDGRPSARIVLLKTVDHGFVFYTAYDSRKGRELAANPHAALLVYWVDLEREVRVEGRIEKTSDADSAAYFDSRPLGSRLAALSSRQSEVVSGREELERRYAQTEQRYGDKPVRPPEWGGYRLIANAVEFWQGRPNRLHDRVLYTRGHDSWRISRLAP